MIHTIKGDITKITNVQAIVNAANKSLLIRTVAFPSISTGVYHFPVEEAAQIALKTVKQFLEEHPGKIDEVYWVLFDDRTLRVYENALSHIMD